MGWLETRKVFLFFALATLLPVAALGWLGVRTLGQERELEQKRRVERLKVAADRVAVDIERELQRVEARLAQGRGIRLDAHGVRPADGVPIFFQPEIPIELGLLSAEFLAAARLETLNSAAAVAAYQRIARASTGATKGEALVALGGLHRRSRRLDAALSAYRELATLGPVRVAGGQRRPRGGRSPRRQLRQRSAA